MLVRLKSPARRLRRPGRSVTSMRPSGRKASDQGWSRPSTSFTTRKECSSDLYWAPAVNGRHRRRQRKKRMAPIIGVGGLMNTLLYEVKDHVARITFNRPDAANALDMEMGRDLMHAAIRASEDPQVRAVILTGAGKMFSAGGAGMSLCLFADLAIAAESAKFTLAYTRAGLSPDGGSTYFLPRIVGVRRALELALTNRVLSAREAMDWGIVNRVVPDAELQNEVSALAKQLAAGATGALGAAKRLLHHSSSESLETQMELEAQAIAERARTADAREGIAAFIAKRPANFNGS